MRTRTHLRYTSEMRTYAYIYANENSPIEGERYRRGTIKILLLTLTVDMVV
jgi:hypothetical protein